MRYQFLSLSFATALSVTVGSCSDSASPPTAHEPVAQSEGGSAGGAATPPVPPPPAAGGTAGVAVDQGVGLTSAVFGSLDDLLAQPDGGTVDPCDYGDTPACDFDRIDGCCSHLACQLASDDPDNPYPMQSCQALLTCVQANPGCSSAADPLCFQNEDPNAPCLDEGYLASHTDPEGPFVFTVGLMNCLCGY